MAISLPTGAVLRDFVPEDRLQKAVELAIQGARMEVPLKSSLSSPVMNLFA